MNTIEVSEVLGSPEKSFLSELRKKGEVRVPMGRLVDYGIDNPG